MRLFSCSRLTMPLWFTHLSVCCYVGIVKQFWTQISAVSMHLGFYYFRDTAVCVVRHHSVPFCMVKRCESFSILQGQFFFFALTIVLFFSSFASFLVIERLFLLDANSCFNSESQSALHFASLAPFLSLAL